MAGSPERAPKGVGMRAGPHQGRTRAVLRKLAPEASSLNMVRSSLRGSKKKTQISGKEVSVPGWTLRVSEPPRDQSSSP